MCPADGPTQLSVAPLDPANTFLIEPEGKHHGSHVTPTDHAYFWHDQIPVWEQGGASGPFVSPYDVRAPASGVITQIEAFTFKPAPYGFTGVVPDYRVVIWHSCSLSSIFIHLGGLAPEILDVTGEIPEGTNWFMERAGDPVVVEAGQIIGKVGSVGFDYSLHDTNVVLSGFVIPSRYDGEPWKIHTVDFYEYFVEPVRSQLLAKNPRTVAPLGGRIDYDIDGRLVGNWFLDGTTGYGDGPAGGDYWSAHLSIAYDYIDPAQIRVSIGAPTGIGEEQCRVCLGVYGVKSNGPDPGDITVDSGLVVYELVARERTDGSRVVTHNVDSEILGVFLVQMMDDRTIKMETVAGATAADVTAFSDAAAIYRR